MPHYETVFIARQDVTAAQVEALADTFAKVVEDQGGRLVRREHWGLRTLAFRIRKNRKGHYVLFNIEAPSAAVQELERQLRIHEDILRYLTIRLDSEPEGPSVMMQSRGGRGDERGGRFRDERGRDDRPRGGDRGRPPRRFGEDNAFEAATSVIEEHE